LPLVIILLPRYFGVLNANTVGGIMKTLILILMILVAVPASAESYKDRLQKKEYIEQHGGHKSETGVRSGKYQVEFGDRHDYKDAFKRSEENAGTRKPKAVIDAPAHQRARIKSEAKRRNIEVEFEEE
jgi:hypothetical protein